MNVTKQIYFLFIYLFIKFIYLLQEGVFFRKQGKNGFEIKCSSNSSHIIKFYSYYCETSPMSISTQILLK